MGIARARRLLRAGLLWVLAFVVGFAASDLDIVGLGVAPEPPNGYDVAAVILYRGALPVLLCGGAMLLLATVRTAAQRSSRGGA